MTDHFQFNICAGTVRFSAAGDGAEFFVGPADDGFLAVFACRFHGAMELS